MDLSIVVTTYDRLDLLKICLSGLALQNAAKSSYEVIVIDNAGQEACRDLVCSFGFRYFHEEVVGHCHARNRGLKEANSDWVLYFDDDTKIPPDTIKNFVAFLPEHHDIAALGGRFHHWYLEEPADWLKVEFGEGLNPGKRRSYGPLEKDEYLIGCFFGVRVGKALSIGGFDPEYGMKGKEVGWADETELQYRLRSKGWEIYYAPELVIEHLIQPWKASFGGRLRYAYSHGKKNWQSDGNGKYPLITFLQQICIITFFILPVTLLRWLLTHREWYLQNVILKVLRKYAFALGRFSKKWKVKQL